MEELIKKAITDGRKDNTIEKLYFLNHVMDQMLHLESLLKSPEQGLKEGTHV